MLCRDFRGQVPSPLSTLRYESALVEEQINESLDACPPSKSTQQQQQNVKIKGGIRILSSRYLIKKYTISLKESAYAPTFHLKCNNRGLGHTWDRSHPCHCCLVPSLLVALWTSTHECSSSMAVKPRLQDDVRTVHEFVLSR